MKTKLAAPLVFIGIACLAFFLRNAFHTPATSIPLSQVFAYAAPTEQPSIAAYRQSREAQRADEMAALEKNASENFQAQQELADLLTRQEKELALETALTARYGGDVICALREDIALICTDQSLDAQTAQSMMEICTEIWPIDIENVLILDECGYL